MNENYVIFTQRAFNSIATEVIDKHPVETGGILIGYVLDNGAWIVVENIPPGYHTIHKCAYFEYDAEFVNYLSNVIALQYKGNLQILGLWHRHPGSMDTFSKTDDGTNIKFAGDRQCGAISALVNCDPQMRLTMYHVSPSGLYTQIQWYVDDGETIPPEFLELHYTEEDTLPVFDKDGIVDKDTPIASHDELIPEDATTEAPMTPYTINDAILDFKEIIHNLRKGYK
jgi:proteasome lid subunit RPN8/RPN11